MRVWACLTVRPDSSWKWEAAASGASDSHPGVPQLTGRSRPSRPTTVRVGRESSRHHTTSVVSPKVQIMAMPDPFSGSANSWASTGTCTPNRGVRTSVPNRAGSGRRRGGPPGPRRPGAARAGWSRCPPRRRGPPGEPDAVVGAWALPVLQLGLGHRGPEVHIPQSGGGALDHLAPLGQVDEPALGHPLGLLGDGGVGVDQSTTGPGCATGARRPARPPRSTGDRGHEVGARDGDRVLGRFGRWGEGGVEGEARVATDPEVVLDPALGGETVVPSQPMG